MFNGIKDLLIRGKLIIYELLYIYYIRKRQKFYVANRHFSPQLDIKCSTTSEEIAAKPLYLINNFILIKYCFISVLFIDVYQCCDLRVIGESKLLL